MNPIKNFEIICEATKRLNSEINQDLYQVVLTIDGSEDTYAKDVVNQYNSVSNIHFTGLLSLDEVFTYYTNNFKILEMTTHTWKKESIWLNLFNILIFTCINPMFSTHYTNLIQIHIQ